MIQDPTVNQHMTFTLYNRFNSPAYIIIRLNICNQLFIYRDIATEMFPDRNASWPKQSDPSGQTEKSRIPLGVRCKNGSIELAESDKKIRLQHW